MTQIPGCCGGGIGLWLVPIRHLVWELPHAAGVALKSNRKKKKRESKRKKERMDSEVGLRKFPIVEHRKIDGNITELLKQSRQESEDPTYI